LLPCTKLVSTLLLADGRLGPVLKATPASCLMTALACTY